MNNRTLSNIDKCIEDLTGYISVRVSRAFMKDENLDEEINELVSSIANLVEVRVKIDEMRKTVTEVEIPEFLNK